MNSAKLLQILYDPASAFFWLLEEEIIQEIQQGKIPKDIAENFSMIVTRAWEKGVEFLKGPNGKEIVPVIFRRALLKLKIGEVLKGFDIENLQYPNYPE